MEASCSLPQRSAACQRVRVHHRSSVVRQQSELSQRQRVLSPSQLRPAPTEHSQQSMASDDSPPLSILSPSFSSQSSSLPAVSTPPHAPFQQRRSSSLFSLSLSSSSSSSLGSQPLTVSRTLSFQLLSSSSSVSTTSFPSAASMFEAVSNAPSMPAAECEPRRSSRHSTPSRQQEDGFLSSHVQPQPAAATTDAVEGRASNRCGRQRLGQRECPGQHTATAHAALAQGPVCGQDTGSTQSVDQCQWQAGWWQARVGRSGEVKRGRAG